MPEATMKNASGQAGVSVVGGQAEATRENPQANYIGSDEPAQAAIFIDEDFKALIPALAPDEYSQLEANILAEGCRDALVLWHDVLIDGHNRYEICQKHGLPFHTVQNSTIKSVDDAVLWIVRNQLGRRNITDFVRGELALLAKPIIEGRAKEKQLATLKQGDSPVRPKSDERENIEAEAEDGQLATHEQGDSPVPQISDEREMRTDDVIASQAGVGRDTIRKIEKIQQTAVPEVLSAVRSGEISINTAAKVATLPAEQQSAIAAAGPVGIKRAAAEVAPARKATEAPRAEAGLKVDSLGADELEQLRAENAELRASMKETLADNEMMGRVFDADDRIKAAMDEAKRQKAIAENAERTLAAKNGEYIERARAVAYWKNRAEKAEKALKVAA